MAVPIARCWDVTEAHVNEAIASRHGMTTLLQAMVAVARPSEGAAKILIVLARMSVECEWLEGSLRVEIEGTGATTRLAVLEDLGGGLRERVFPRFNLNVPVAEFERGLRLAPRAVEPLVVRMDDDKIVLTKTVAHGASQRPPSFELAEDCLQKALPATVQKAVQIAAIQVPAPVRERVAAPSPGNTDGITFSIPRTPKTLDLSELGRGRPQIRRVAPPPAPPGKTPPQRRSKPPPK